VARGEKGSHLFPYALRKGKKGEEGGEASTKGERRRERKSAMRRPPSLFFSSTPRDIREKKGPCVRGGKEREKFLTLNQLLAIPGIRREKGEGLPKKKKTGD